MIKVENGLLTVDRDKRWYNGINKLLFESFIAIESNCCDRQ